MKERRLAHLLRMLVLILALPTATAVAQAPAAQERWLATWGAALQQPAPNSALSNQTIRMFVRASVGGSRVRLQLSNMFGTAPLVLGPVHVALHGQGSAIALGSDRALLFSGKHTVKIPPGAVAVSDPVNLDVPALGDLAISIYAPEGTAPAPRQSTALRTNYLAAGDVTGAAELTGATTTPAWLWISSVEVMAPANAGAIVVLGPPARPALRLLRTPTEVGPACWLSGYRATLRPNTFPSSIWVSRETGFFRIPQTLDSALWHGLTAMYWVMPVCSG